MANGKHPWCEYHTSPYLSIVQARVMKGNDLALGVMRTKRCGAGPRDRAGLQSCGTRWRQGEGNRSERVVGLGVCHVFQDAVTRILTFVTLAPSYGRRPRRPSSLLVWVLGGAGSCTASCGGDGIVVGSFGGRGRGYGLVRGD